MLQNIKASYFIKIVFSFLNYRRQLNLIKYNKHLQNNMNIQIIDFMRLSGRCVVYERNGKGKEYTNYNTDQGNLLYEGEYLNGKRNGIGKEYDLKGNLIFEGEYLKGKRNGKGKEYNKIGLVIFEGQYLNDERWNGKYTKYFSNTQLEFEGEYINGIINGKGKEYYYNGNLKFEGEYLNDKKWDGKGYDELNKIIYE